MRDLLNDQRLPPDVKMSLYYELLEKFSRYRKEVNQPYKLRVENGVGGVPLFQPGAAQPSQQQPPQPQPPPQQPAPLAQAAPPPPPIPPPPSQQAAASSKAPTTGGPVASSTQTSPVDPSLRKIGTYTEQILLKDVPPTKKNAGKLLIQHLDENPHLDFSANNEVIYKGHVLPNSNVYDIVQQLVRDLKTPRVPGLEHVVAGLKEAKAPESVIANKHYKGVTFSPQDVARANLLDSGRRSRSQKGRFFRHVRRTRSARRQRGGRAAYVCGSQRFSSGSWLVRGDLRSDF